uniref:FAD-binding oxidoreductase n=1 Tax=Pseudactinotalea sp. TaxID=1926260 RepID=UPI003B3B15C5
LRSRVAGPVLSTPDELERYRRDRAADPNAGTPLAAVRAQSVADVQATLRFASEHGIGVIPRGAGSGLSGGASAYDGALVLSVEDMGGIAIDPVTMTATVGPGVLNSELKAAAAEHGLWYPPDPASFTFCSIGGNIATNAGGLCCVKYGVTRDYVMGLTVVLADGSVVELGGRLIKDVAGLPLIQLFIGSEGTLGVIVSATLRLKAAPPPSSTLLVTFDDIDKAGKVVCALARTGRLSMLELMDRTTVECVERVHRGGLDTSACATVIVQSDEAGAAGEAALAAAAEICRDGGALTVQQASTAEQGEHWAHLRRVAIPSVEECAGSLLLGDVGVPLPSLGKLMAGIEEISARSGVPIALIAHAGDGNTHPLVMRDVSSAETIARADAAYGEVMDLAIALDGTITGEHGVGRLKRPWLAANVGEDVVRLNAAVKTALDPQGILNPGAAF